VSAIPENAPATNGWLINLHAHDHVWNREPDLVAKMDATKMFREYMARCLWPQLFRGENEQSNCSVD
jgi:hypothetical protein